MDEERDSREILLRTGGIEEESVQRSWWSVRFRRPLSSALFAIRGKKTSTYVSRRRTTAYIISSLLLLTISAVVVVVVVGVPALCPLRHLRLLLFQRLKKKRQKQ